MLYPFYQPPGILVLARQKHLQDTESYVKISGLQRCNRSTPSGTSHGAHLDHHTCNSRQFVEGSAKTKHTFMSHMESRSGWPTIEASHRHLLEAAFRKDAAQIAGMKNGLHEQS